MASIPPNHPLTLDYRAYRRPFAQPLKAAWGTWEVREGILVRLRDPESGTATFGEVAPLPAFGSEGMDEALAFFHSLQANPSAAQLEEAIAMAPPASAFGLWCALSGSSGEGPIRSAALLSLGEQTVDEIKALRDRGFRTFKLKSGLAPMEAEWELLQSTITGLEHGECLRLDPNQSWDHDAGQFWFSRLDAVAEKIEFIEEPFEEGLYPVDQMVAVAANSPVPLALDESLSRMGLSEWLDNGWPGFWIIKPSLMGNPDQWRQSLGTVHERVVLSSVFETGIGLGKLAALAARINDRDHGFGTEAYFEDTFGIGSPGNDQETRIWNHLPSA
ncbi:MAG: o-succinylbenzoate synthase [Puniceicoccaceae bacterium]